MSIIETVADVDNSFLSRRELTCNFAGLAGRLQKLEAVDMITKEFKLDGKVVIPMRLRTHVGKPLVTGTFFVYDDEALAKRHVNPTIFSRLDRARAKLTEAQKSADEAPSEEAKDAPAKDDAPDAKKDAPAEEDATTKGDAPEPAKDDAPKDEPAEADAGPKEPSG